MAATAPTVVVVPVDPKTTQLHNAVNISASDFVKQMDETGRKSVERLSWPHAQAEWSTKSDKAKINVMFLSGLTSTQLDCRLLYASRNQNRTSDAIIFVQQICDIVSISMMDEMVPEITLEQHPQVTGNYFMANEIYSLVEDTLTFMKQSCPALREQISIVSLSHTYCRSKLPNASILNNAISKLVTLLKSHQRFVTLQERQPVSVLQMLATELNQIKMLLATYLYSISYDTAKFDPPQIGAKAKKTRIPDRCLLYLDFDAARLEALMAQMPRPGALRTRLRTKF